MKMSTPTQDVVVNGSFETSDYKISEIGWILDMLADKTYTHKVRAVIRELYCNGDDSHQRAIELGELKENCPIDVHLPTKIESWFSLRDYGTGLSDDDVRTKYAGLGISTKRDSDKYIGCMGIGNLSPYSLVDSFTLTSYFNGVCSIYNCLRDSKRCPVVALISRSDTEEPNGVEVKLSIKPSDIYKFKEEAINVFKWWDTLPNINDSEVLDACNEWNDNFLIKNEKFGIRSNSYSTTHAVMGNVAYPIPYSLDKLSCGGYLKFEMGELEFDTARENITVTDELKETLTRKFKEVNEAIDELYIKEVNKETTAYTKARKSNELQGNKAIRESLVNVDLYKLPTTYKSFTKWINGKRTQLYNIKSFNNRYYIHKDRMTSRIRQYSKDVKFNIIVFDDMNQAIESGLDIDLLRDIDEIPKCERSTTGSKSVSKLKTFLFNFSSWDDKKCWLDHKLELSSKEIVYIEISRWNPVYMSNNKAIESRLADMRSLGISPPDVVGLKTSFCKTKLFKEGNFINLMDYLKRELKKVVIKTHYTFNGRDLALLRALSECLEKGSCGNAKLNQLNKSMKEKIKLAEGNDYPAHAIDILRRYDIEYNGVNDTLIQDYIDAVFNRFPIIKLIPKSSIQYAGEDVVNYLMQII